MLQIRSPERAAHALAPGQPFANGVGGARSAGGNRLWIDTALRDAGAARADAIMQRAASGIPRFDRKGNLPSGVFHAQWGEFTSRFANTPRRAELTSQLGRALGELQGMGVHDAVIGGSFVTSKRMPGDVDMAVFAPNGGYGDVPARLRNVLSRVAPDVSIYSARHVVGNAPVLPGARPGETFLEFFQHDRTGVQRGAVWLKPQSSAVIDAMAGVAKFALKVL